MITSKTTPPSVWQLQTAKAQFSKVVRGAVESGPQLITKAGNPAVYIISADLYEAEFSGNSKDRKSILLASPHHDTELELDRDKDEGREVEL